MNLKYSNLVLIHFYYSIHHTFFDMGTFFPDLIVSISSLFFMYYIVKNKNFISLTTKPLIIFFIFCVYCILVSLLIAEDIIQSLKSSLFYFRIGVFSCFIWYLIDKDKSILTYFYYALILCFSALVVDGYIQYFTGVNLSGYKASGYRISSFFGDEFIMGSYISRLFPLLFALFLVKKKTKIRNLFYRGFIYSC